MDDQTKQMTKGELQVIKGLLSSAASLGANLSQANYPVTGPMVMIPSLPPAAQAIKMQSDATIKLINLIEKLVDKL